MARAAMIIGNDTAKGLRPERNGICRRANTARIIREIRDSSFRPRSAVRSYTRASHKHGDGGGGDQRGRRGDCENSEPGATLHNILSSGLGPSRRGPFSRPQLNCQIRWFPQLP